MTGHGPQQRYEGRSAELDHARSIPAGSQFGRIEQARVGLRQSEGPGLDERIERSTAVGGDSLKHHHHAIPDHRFSQVGREDDLDFQRFAGLGSTQADGVFVGKRGLGSGSGGSTGVGRTS